MSSSLKKVLIAVGVLLGVVWVFGMLASCTNSYIRDVALESRSGQQTIVQMPIAQPTQTSTTPNVSADSSKSVLAPWYFNSGEKGSAVLPLPAVCHGDLVDIDGKIYGDGVGGNPPVMVDSLIPAGSKVDLIWGSCSTEQPDQVWARLAVRPEGFVKVSP